MSTKFIPLSPGNLPKAQGGFVPKIVGNEASHSNTATGEDARTRAGACGNPSSGSPSAEPAVELKKDGDRVTEITIRCSCGEVIRLDCS